MTKRFSSAVVFFLLIIFVGCNDADKELSVRIDALLGGFGLTSNVFQTEPQAQLGTLIFYRSKKIIEEFRQRFEFKGPSQTVLQIQGQLAKKILEHFSDFSKGTIKSDQKE